MKTPKESYERPYSKAFEFEIQSVICEGTNLESIEDEGEIPLS